LPFLDAQRAPTLRLDTAADAAANNAAVAEVSRQQRPANNWSRAFFTPATMIGPEKEYFNRRQSRSACRSTNPAC
jgi:hypothetical protein